MGYIIAGIKELQAAKVGDTVITVVKNVSGGGAFTATEPLPGFKEIQPQVFAGPTPRRPANMTRDAMRWKAQAQRCLAALRARVSQALGFGFPMRLLGSCTWRSCRSAWSVSSTRT